MAVNTAYLSIQLSEEGSEIFIGFVRRCENDKYVYDCRKFKLLETTAGKLDYLIEQQAGAVSNYYKTPLLTKADQNALQEECSHIMAKVRNDMESIFGVYLQHLDEFINLEPPVESPEEVNTSPGGKPAAQKAKDAGKKPDPKGGNKKDVGISHEVLVPSKSGIDHIVMFVDERYILLPFQLLPLVKDVPLISKDYSLQTYTKRIETMSAENGGENLSLNKTQYIAYDFKDAEGELDEARSPIKFSSMMDALKSSNNVSLQGVNSNQRIPSLGNWQLSLRESDTLIYYGNKPFLHLLSPAMLLDLVNTCRTRCFMISDRINPIKKHIAKFDSLDEDQDLVMIKEMPKLSLALLTIMGAAVIVYNQGPIDPEYNLEIFYGILGGITNTAGVANQSFSKALAEHRAGRKTLLIPGNDKPVGPAGYPRASVEHPVQATKGGAKAQPAHIQKDKPQGEEGYEEYSEIMISQYSILGVGSTRLEARETK